MTGLEKIVEQILADANAEAENILKAAGQEADGIIQEAENKALLIRTQSEQKIAEEKAGGITRAEASSDLKKRQEILKAKQEIISDVLKKAYLTVLQSDDKKYFEMIEKMLDKFVLDKAGEIHFCDKDIARLPENFADIIESAAKSKGGTLKLSDVPADIDGGFVLVYGGIEENCSFSAIINAEREMLADKVRTFLFA